MLLQNLVVLLIVAVAAGYSAWKLVPAHWRRGAARQSGHIARAAGVGESLARRIEVRVVAAADASGCGNCGPCKGCAVGRGAGDDARDAEAGAEESASTTPAAHA